MQVAIVGCGKVGRRHADQYRRLGANIVGCHDAQNACAEAFAKDYATASFHTLEELLAISPHGISICTPPNSHVTVAAAAIERGVNVLCEKPLASRLEDCSVLRPSALFTSAFKFRHLAGAGPLREAIARGELGQIVSVRGTAVSDLDMSDKWFSRQSSAGGGVLIDNGVHLIDLCRFLMGDVAEVCASVSGGTRGLEVEESASINLRMTGGATIHLFVSWESPAPVPPLLEIYGSKGYARLGYELEILDRSGKNRSLHIPADGVDIWHEVVANFVHHLANGSPQSATFEDGWKALSAVDAAYRSLTSGCWTKPRTFPGV